jgi:ubiquitin-like modifier-activating enzyme 5
MGVVPEWTVIYKKSLAVVGLGGVGSVAAEMLVRCGVRKLVLVDLDRVELANLNRLFYRPEHVGRTKVDVAVEILSRINPDVELIPFSIDVSGVYESDVFSKALLDHQVDLLLACVDNYTARMSLNAIALELDLPWMEAGVSENAMSGHIQTLLPGRTACFMCCPPVIVESEELESTILRPGVCAASLPTTMCVISSFLVQNALKYLIKFGQVSMHLGYNALLDFFPKTPLRRNPSCSNERCKTLQQKYSEWVEDNDFAERKQVQLSVETSINPWNIQVLDGGTQFEEKGIITESTFQDLSLSDLKNKLSALKRR